MAEIPPDSSSNPGPRRGIFSSLGPAIVTASVVLGPGSILAASKTGHQFGFQMTWVLAVAVLLMIGMTALAARLGVTLEHSICDELAIRAGRPFAVLAGLTVFLVCACFQFSNNLGLLASVEPLLPADDHTNSGFVIGLLTLVLINGLTVCALYGFRSLYRPIELLMKVLVATMTITFTLNLIAVRPDLLQLLGGLIPSLPEGTGAAILPYWKPGEGGTGQVVQTFQPVTALTATTFSVAAAFYQAYLVREKGWTLTDARRGLVDSALGIALLGFITLVILTTAATALHGRADIPTLSNAAAVAVQLEPLVGRSATVLFCAGIFAGAFSSFLVNAMIGGTMLADGLGLGGSIDNAWSKHFTTVALVMGSAVAVIVLATKVNVLPLIIFAQAATVIGFPILAMALLWLATRKDMVGTRAIPTWMKVLAFIGLLVVLFAALSQAMNISLKIMHWNELG